MNPAKLEYIKSWLYRANEDIAVIESLINAGIESYTSTISFHAQQASEKFLKAFLVYKGINFPNTHDIDYLLQQCQTIDKKAFDIDVKDITDFGVSIRYPDDFYIPSVREALEYRDIAAEIKIAVESFLKEIK
ncbi:MAG: HEPN domain-containing protein [Bacteroidota bacterium]